MGDKYDNKEKGEGKGEKSGSGMKDMDKDDYMSGMKNMDKDDSMSGMESGSGKMAKNDKDMFGKTCNMCAAQCKAKKSMKKDKKPQASGEKMWDDDMMSGEGMKRPR